MYFCSSKFNKSTLTNVGSTGVASSRLRQNMGDMFDQYGICIQADMISSNESAQDTTIQETTEFVSEVGETKIDMSMSPSYLMSLTDENSSLSNFLSRPFEIYSKNWTEGTALDPAIDFFYPWYLFLNRNTITNKIQHYYLLRANLHLKVIVNASPFYYGAALLSYAPNSDIEPAIVSGSGSTAYNVGYSQRPHIDIYPQSNQGGELVLPFMYRKEWVDITNSSDVTNLGRCRFSSFGDLLNANGVTGKVITIQVYAWLEDVQLSGPTAQTALQGEEVKDEYAEGPLSKPASAIARSASMLSNLPYVGSFFTATSFAAEKVAGVAKLFGYTNVPVIEDVHAFKNQPFPQLSSCDVGVPSEIIALDSKNGLSVDPHICSVDSKDELLITNFVARESFVFDFSWSETNGAGAFLARMAVDPFLQRVISGTQEKYIHRTPLGHAATMFQYWRGDIIFRFKIICSQFHRGRLIITWDPAAVPSADGERLFNKIVDISENTDVEIRVPYMQALAYLRTRVTSDSFEHWQSPGSATSDFEGLLCNGSLGVYVNNPLTSPVGSSTIKVLVYVRGAENIEFAAPRGIASTLSPYQVQSQDITTYDTDKTSLTLGNVSTITDDNINLVYHGESIKSLRTLYRRNGTYRAVGSSVPYDATGNTMVAEVKQSRRPLYPGFDPNGVDLARGLVSGTYDKYNWVRWTAMTWLDQCFVGVKGSVRWVFSLKNGSSKCLLTTCRYTGTTGLTSAAYTPAYVTETTINGVGRRLVGSAVYDNMSGMAMSNSDIMPSLDVVMPMYSRFKFLESSPKYRTLGSPALGSDLDAITVGLTTNPIDDGNNKLLYLVSGVSASADYTPVFFLNVPTLYLYDSLPNVT